MNGWVWVFHGDKGRLSSAVFSSRENAEAWVRKYALSGILTKMPVDQSAYDWAVETGAFKPAREDQRSAVFVQTFTSACLEHYHFTDGG